MPRVSSEHLAARRRQILDAARACFVRDGFHATSMQDILREADLSAGAVYRYFPSKDAIVVAIATEAIEQVAAAFAAALHTDPLPSFASVLTTSFTTVERMERDDHTATIIVQVWGEAVRNDAVQSVLTGVVERMTDVISDVVRRYQDAGALNRATPARHVAAALIGLVQAAIVQRALFGPDSIPAYQDGLRALTTRPDITPRQVDKTFGDRDDGGRSASDPESVRRDGSD